MKVALTLHPALRQVPNIPWWAMAWQAGETIHIRRPFHRFFFAKARAAHELAHALGEHHHPWTHFCIRSPIALRPRWTCTSVTPEQAAKVLEEGVVELG